MATGRRTIILYIFNGALFGALFPIGATVVDILMRGLPIAVSSIGAVQASQPLHWMINTAPIFLGLFAGMAGRRQAKAEQINADLALREAALQAALQAAERADERARLSAENAQLYERASQQLQQLQVALAERDRHLETIHQLTAPIIPVTKTILVLPLIGDIDAERLTTIEARLLQRISAGLGAVVIFDCTGVTSCVGDAPRGLAGLVSALRLLGARAILTGISPNLARELLDSALADAPPPTASDLASGIALATRVPGGPAPGSDGR